MIPWLPEFLAKSTGLLLIALATDLALRHFHPKWRVILGRISLLGLLALPLLITGLPRWSIERPHWVSQATASAPPLATATLPVPPSTHAPILEFRETPAPVSSPSISFATAAIVIWLTGLSYFLIRMVIGRTHMARLRHRSFPPPPEIAHWAGRTSQGLSLRHPLAVRMSSLIPTPILIGWWRPIALLPNGLFNDTDEKHSWAAVLAHEGAHVRHADPFWRLIFQLCTAILWLHPLVWLLHRTHNSATEELADATATAYIGDADCYKQTLATVALRHYSWQISTAALPMASRGSLSSRLAHLPGNLARKPMGRTSLVLCISLATVAFGIGAAISWAQTTSSDADNIQHSEEPLVIRCIDPEGRPVAGAQVYLIEFHRRHSMYHSLSDYPSTSSGPLITNGEGMVNFPAPITFDGGQSLRSITAISPGKLAGGGFFDSGPSPQTPSEPAIINMLPTTPIRGKLSMIDGSDPSQATITLLIWAGQNIRYQAGGGRFLPGGSFPWPELFQSRPNADGTFQIDDIPTDALAHIQATAPGYGEVQTSRPLGSSDAISILLEPQATITGTVTSKRTGEPAANIQILAYPRFSKLLVPFPAKTDEDGHFRIVGLGAGTYDVKVDWSKDLVMTPTRVTIKAGETARLSLVSEQVSIITGTVTSDNKPVAGVMIAAVASDIGGEGLDSTRTNEQGRYELRVPSGASVLYLADIPQRFVYPKDQDRRTLNLSEGKIISGSPDFVLNKKETKTSRQPSEPASAKGRVLDPQGKPVAGALISYWREPIRDADHPFPPGAESGPLTTTDQDGYYQIKLSPFFKYEIRAGGQITSTAKSARFATASGSSHQLETLVIHPANATASGIVVDEAGTPIVNAYVDSSSKNKYAWEANKVTTDADGRFQLPHLLPDEPFMVMVQKSGYNYRFSEKLAPGDTAIRIVLTLEK